MQDIKRNSEQSILLYRDLIQTTMCKKELIHSDQEIKSKIKKLDENLKEYQLALYLYSFYNIYYIIFYNTVQPYRLYLAFISCFLSAICFPVASI